MILPASAQLVRACRALNRLARRLHGYQHSGRPGSSAPTCLDGLRPWPPLLDGADPRMTVSGAIAAVLRAQEHLLAQLDGTLPFDRVEAVWALQELSGSGYGWSTPARRLAAALGVELRGVPCDYGRRRGVEVDDRARLMIAARPRSENSDASARQSPDATAAAAGETVSAGKAVGTRRAGSP